MPDITNDAPEQTDTLPDLPDGPLLPDEQPGKLPQAQRGIAESKSDAAQSDTLHAAVKTVRALNNKHAARQNGIAVSWNAAKNEICHQLAGVRWLDRDFTDVTYDQLVNDPRFSPFLDDLHEQLEQLCLIEAAEKRARRQEQERRQQARRKNESEAEEQRRVSEKRIAEEQRRNEEKRIAEEKRLAQESRIKREDAVSQIAEQGWELSEDDIGVIYDVIELLPLDDEKDANAHQNRIRAAFEAMMNGDTGIDSEITVQEAPQYAAMLTQRMLVEMISHISKLYPKEKYNKSLIALSEKYQSLDPDAVRQEKEYEAAKKLRRETIDRIAAQGWSFTKDEIGILYDAVQYAPANDPKNPRAPQNRLRTVMEHLKNGINPGYADYPVSEYPKYAELMTSQMLSAMLPEMKALKPNKRRRKAAGLIGEKLKSLESAAKKQEKMLTAEIKKREDAIDGTDSLRDSHSALMREAAVNDFTPLSGLFALKKTGFGTKNASLQPLKRMIDRLTAGCREDAENPLSDYDRISLLYDIQNEALAVSAKKATKKDPERMENIMKVLQICEAHLCDAHNAQAVEDYNNQVREEIENDFVIIDEPKKADFRPKDSISGLAEDVVKQLQENDLAALLEECIDPKNTDTGAKIMALRNRTEEKLAKLIVAKTMSRVLDGLDNMPADEVAKILPDIYRKTCGLKDDAVIDVNMPRREMLNNMIEAESKAIRSREDFRHMMSTVECTRKGIAGLLSAAKDENKLMIKLAKHAQIVQAHKEGTDVKKDKKKNIHDVGLVNIG